MKDLFSKQAGIYAKYRPGYPDDLIDFILALVKEREFAWDVATGNGQAAKLLAPYFLKVFATDISAKQISQSAHESGIEYLVAPAEKTDFPDNQYVIISVPLAYICFTFDFFKKYATRVSKPGGIIAVWGYCLIKTDNKELMQFIHQFYTEVVGKYWDPERKYVDEAYRSIPFPYEELPSKQFSIMVYWSKEDLIGYLNTWSSVQHYIEANQKNPVDEFAIKLESIWDGNGEKQFTFPLFLRIGRIQK
ncbi:MAG: class I SAM-dependent methyltransferase [Chitinophagales bacterium]